MVFWLAQIELSAAPMVCCYLKGGNANPTLSRRTCSELSAAPIVFWLPLLVSWPSSERHMKMETMRKRPKRPSCPRWPEISTVHLTHGRSSCDEQVRIDRVIP